MKKIHITESQLRYCIRKLNEVVNVDVTQAFTADGNNFGSNCKKTIADAGSDGLQKDELNATINGSALDENNMQMYTKKQLKEARRNKLISECNTVIKKKDIDNKKKNKK